MYVTKVIDRFGGIEMVAKSIDELCNQMDKDGYSLVTYQFCANNEKGILTFKKGIKNYVWEKEAGKKYVKADFKFKRSSANGKRIKESGAFIAT